LAAAGPVQVEKSLAIIDHAVSSAHFASVPDWTAARAMLVFQPLERRQIAGYSLRSIRIHMRDHKLRDLPIEERTIEAHFGAFTLSQARKGLEEARRLALEVSYGGTPRDARVAGRAARVYELGPEPPPDDINGRSPSVVTWHDGGIFFLLASGEMSSGELMQIATSLYMSRRTDGSR
jgi:hypothetical protein